MSTREYKGMRYVPIIGRKGESSVEWDGSKAYEHLTVVTHEGASYTSRQAVPAGVQITNQAYWAHTGNYNAQVELYRREVRRLTELLGGIEAKVASNRIEYDIHPTRSKNDTGYVFVKIPRDMYELSFANCNGDAHDLATKTDTVLHYARDFGEGESFFTNCTFGGYDTDGRLNGTDHHGTVVSPTSGRRFMAMTEDFSDIEFYPITTSIDSVPSKYVNVFEVGYRLIIDGVVQELSSTAREPRNAFGWDDEYFYVLVTEGRGVMQLGYTYTDCAQLLYEKGCADAVEFDGGGSVQMVYSDGDIVRPVNWYRDFAEQYSYYRKVTLVAKYKLKDGAVRPVNERGVLDYRLYNNGFSDIELYRGNTGTQTIEFDESEYNAWHDFEGSSRNLFQWLKYRFWDGYEVGTSLAIPLPYKSYNNHVCRVSFFTNIMFPNGKLDGQAVFDVRLFAIDTHYEPGEEGYGIASKNCRVTVLDSDSDHREVVSVNWDFLIPDSKHEYIVKAAIRAVTDETARIAQSIQVAGSWMDLSVKEHAV